MTPKSYHLTVRLLVLTLPLLFLNGCALSLGLSAPQSVANKDAGIDAKTLSAEAYALMQQNQPQAAIEKARRAVQLDPSFAEAQKNLALAYCDSGRAEEAVEPARKAVTLAPDFDKARFVFGKTLYGLGRYDESIKQLKEAIRINSNYDKAYFKLGLAYDRVDNLKEALPAFDQAVRIKPEDWDYQVERDRLRGFVRLQEQPAAEVPLAPVTGKTPEFANAIYIGTIYECLIHRQYDLIERSAERARTSKEKLAGGWWKLHKIYDALEGPEEPNSASDCPH